MKNERAQFIAFDYRAKERTMISPLNADSTRSLGALAFLK